MFTSIDGDLILRELPLPQRNELFHLLKPELVAIIAGGHAEKYFGMLHSHFSVMEQIELAIAVDQLDQLPELLRYAEPADDLAAGYLGYSQITQALFIQLMKQATCEGFPLDVRIALWEIGAQKGLLRDQDWVPASWSLLQMVRVCNRALPPDATCRVMQQMVSPDFIRAVAVKSKSPELGDLFALTFGAGLGEGGGGGQLVEAANVAAAAPGVAAEGGASSVSAMDLSGL